MRYNGRDNEMPDFFELISKLFRRTDYLLQFEGMKEELPVIAYQQWCGELVLELCTNRPSRSERRSTRSWQLDPASRFFKNYRASANVCRVTDWNEVVTR